MGPILSIEMTWNAMRQNTTAFWLYCTLTVKKNTFSFINEQTSQIIRHGSAAFVGMIVTSQSVENLHPGRLPHST